MTPDTAAAGRSPSGWAGSLRSLDRARVGSRCAGPLESIGVTRGCHTEAPTWLDTAPTRPSTWAPRDGRSVRRQAGRPSPTDDGRRPSQPTEPWGAPVPERAELDPSPDDTEDERWMRRALSLAVRAQGETYPNPVVGCVIVAVAEAGEIEGVRDRASARAGEGEAAKAPARDRPRAVVGEGYHERAGGPHAEVFALRAAGMAARGATAYVTLEPCAHHGRTAPCEAALRTAGVARVVVGAADPDPRVAGRGVERLRAAGITVDEGCLSVECERVNEQFLRDAAARARSELAAG